MEPSLELSLEDVAEYSIAYCNQFRRHFDRLISDDRYGVQLPITRVPAYASHNPMECWALKDGVVYVDESGEPEYSWYIAGGPALKVDEEPTRTNPEIPKILEREGLTGKPIGICRIVGTDFPAEVWTGTKPKATKSFSLTTDFRKPILFCHSDTTVKRFLEIITFGALGHVLDIDLPNDSDNFWDNFTLNRMGFFPADLNNRRFIQFLEIAHSCSAAAWDKRALWIRCKVDCDHSVASVLSLLGNEGGTLNIVGKSAEGLRKFAPVPLFFDKTLGFEEKLQKLSEMVLSSQGVYEGEVQKYLEENPSLLDLYGTDVSPRPRFIYPEPRTREKSYVEPDFVVSYSDGTYRVVEIERPEKRIIRGDGTPRAETTQAAFQLSEFRTYISRHANMLQDRFPGICSENCQFTLIIGRESLEAQGSSDLWSDRMLHMRNTFNATDVWVYDDLVKRGYVALQTFRGLSDFAPPETPST